MTTQPNHGAPEDRPHSASAAPSNSDSDADSAAAEPIPEWAPLEPLPSSEMFLAVFSGAQPVTAGDVLHPAYDLVECQRKYQLALGVMTGTEASAADLKAAAAMLVTAVADIEVLVTIIDDAVAERLKPQRTGPDKVVQVIEADTAATAASPARMQPDQLAPVPLHTESIGEIAARMADLWERAVARGSEPICTPQPETHQLVELCTGYDYLAAEIESGRRTLPGM